MLRVIVAMLLCAAVSPAQHPRNSWRLKAANPQMYAMKDAPISSSDREEIRRMIEESVGREERQAIIDFEVGLIALSSDKMDDVLVQGTKGFCGATGNCTMWVFVRMHGQLHLALEKVGLFLVPEKNATRGFRDIAISMHDSATSYQYDEYRWNGTRYKRTDCYKTEYPIEGPSGKPPSITGCR